MPSISMLFPVGLSHHFSFFLVFVGHFPVHRWVYLLLFLLLITFLVFLLPPTFFFFFPLSNVFVFSTLQVTIHPGRPPSR